jgi:hypothetical protein
MGYAEIYSNRLTMAGQNMKNSHLLLRACSGPAGPSWGWCASAKALWWTHLGLVWLVPRPLATAFGGEVRSLPRMHFATVLQSLCRLGRKDDDGDYLTVMARAGGWRVRRC